jgi:hypothetical protein
MSATMVRERPILFSGAMVRALLAGTKTQTRRVVKLPRALAKAGATMDGAWADGPSPFAPGAYLHVHKPSDDTWHRVYSPYGYAGDRLYVRESWLPDAPRDATWADTEFFGCKDAPLSLIPRRYRTPQYVLYRATWDGSDLRWRPSIHMPRWASRISLELTGVRVERVQDIREADAIAEGCKRSGIFRQESTTARGRYRELWDSLNKARGYGWDVNPWVWVLEFRRVEARP